MSVTIPTFEKPDGRTYRLAGEWYDEWERGYTEPTLVKDNILQVKRWWGWQTIERERVPTFAWIDVACLGSTSWQSALIAKHQPAAHQPAAHQPHRRHA